MEENVNIREALKVILQNELELDAGEVIDEGVFVYRTLNCTSVSAGVIINSVIETMKELERQVNKFIRAVI